MVKITIHRFITAAGMLIERASETAWRVLVWVLFFGGLWLFEIPAFFGAAGMITAFIIFLLGIGFFCYRDLRIFHLPRADEINRRVEKHSSIGHRPIDTITDTPINPADESGPLWARHIKMARDSIHRLRPALPRAVFARIDPFAIRYGIILFFGISFLLAGPDAGGRITRGLMPFGTIDSPITTPGDLRIVMTPPEYTNVKPIILDRANRGNVFEIPAGSILKGSVHGGMGRPVLQIDDKNHPFVYAEGNNHTIETPLPPDAQKISITRLWISRASWDLKIIPDTPPQITVPDSKALNDGTFRIHAKLKDDYGVRTLNLTMSLGAISVPGTTGAPVTEIRSIMSPPGKEIDITPIYDFTSHPWAGLPAELTLTAEDAAGHKTTAAPLKITLPERPFSHPVAQDIIALRKRLIAAPSADTTNIRAGIEMIIARPDRFNGDLMVALGLRSASSRLYWAAQMPETVAEVISLLWDVALRVEQEGLPMAARDLKKAQQDLENALNDPSLSNEEISRLMENLRQATAEYLSAAAREIQKRAKNGEEMIVLPKELIETLMNPETLAAMLAQMESQMKSGDRDAARKMLSELRNLTEKLNPSAFQPPPEMQAMNKAINEIREIIARQENLLKETQTTNKNKRLADIQKNIRLMLGDAMLKAAEATKQIPDALSLAELEMRTSEKLLAETKHADSIPHQKQAIEYLKTGQKNLNEQMAAMLKQMIGFAMGGMRLDPLGRPMGGNEGGFLPGSDVKIPDELQRKQALEILRLLQKRSGERARPETELDYYRRLLRQF